MQILIALPVRFKGGNKFGHGDDFIVKHKLLDPNGTQGIVLTVKHDGQERELTGHGNGPIDAAVDALRSIGLKLQVRSYEERSIGSSEEGGNARACAFIEVTQPNDEQECYGIGIHANIVTASICALISGANRLWRDK